MTGPVLSRNQTAGANRSGAKSTERSYTRGSLMFIEGETSTEMFIIKRGKVRILKQEGDTTVELAVLGPGSVLGELSLLDKQPRSATAQVVEDVTSAVIDEKDFSHTIAAVPDWLANLIQIIVKRLRDTMRKSAENIVRKSIAGVIRLLLLVYDHEIQPCATGEKRIPIRRAKEVISATMGLGEMEIESAFLHLILKELFLIQKDDVGKEFCIVRDREVIELYMNFLRALQGGGTLLGQNLSDGAIGLLQVVLDIGEKKGKEIKPGIFSIGVAQVEIEHQRQGKGQYIDRDALEELVSSKVIFTEKNTVQTSHQSHKYVSCIYNKAVCSKVILLHLWIQKFKEEITV